MATDPVLLSRYSQDLANDIRGLARYVGNLEEGRSKVSVNSALSVGERWDHFRFRVTGEEFVRLRAGELVGEDGRGADVAVDGAVRYQLLSPSGQVIADSDPNAGAERESWEELISDANLKLAKGWYTIRVARGPAAEDRREYIYSFTLRSGLAPVTDRAEETALREFLTTERPAPEGAVFDQYASVTAVLGLFVNVRIF
jgi:hypothetical protein